jgi:nucleotide-binding universal stress UspA family protein
MTQHILCAVDVTHLDTEGPLLRKAADLAKFYNATLSVVTVVPDYSMSIVGSYFKDGTMKDAVAAADKQLHDFVKTTLPEFGQVQHIIEVGTAYEMILDAINRAQADLVVIGAHRPTLMDKLQGPNSARVARQAPCSVLVVRPDA